MIALMSMIKCELCKRKVPNLDFNISISRINREMQNKMKDLGLCVDSNCSLYVSAFQNMILDEIKDPVSYCQRKNKCPLNPIPLSDRSPSYANNCDYCAKIFKHIMEDGLDTMGAQFGVKVAQSICSKVPAAVPLCATLTKHDMEKLISLIRVKVSYVDICERNGLCT